MNYDKIHRRIFVCDSVGTLFIYNPDESFSLLASIDFPYQNTVKAMCFDPLRNILLTGSNQGSIAVYEIGKSGKEKVSILTGTFDSIKNIRALCFVGGKKELYVGGADGTISFVNTLTT